MGSTFSGAKNVPGKPKNVLKCKGQKERTAVRWVTVDGSISQHTFSFSTDNGTETLTESTISEADDEVLDKCVEDDRGLEFHNTFL